MRMPFTRRGFLHRIFAAAGLFLAQKVSATRTNIAFWRKQGASGTYSLFLWSENKTGTMGLGVAQKVLTQVATNVQTVGTVSDNWPISGHIKTDGTLWVAGYNTYGQLGIGTTTDQYSFVQVPGSWTQFASSRYMSLGIKSNGTLWVWGTNTYGNLGTNNTTNYSSPVQLAGSWTQVATADPRHSGAIKTDGTLWMWGVAGNGQLGNGSTVGRSSPVQVAGTWTQLALGDRMSFGIRSNGTLWAWGHNAYGYLGTNNTTSYSSPVQIPGSYVQVSCTGLSVFARRTDNSAWAWGGNGSAGLGLGDFTNRSSPTQIPGSWLDICSAGFNARGAFGIKSDYSLWGWGYTPMDWFMVSNYAPTSPQQISGPSWTMIKGAGGAVRARKPDGTYWHAGANYRGNMGLGFNAYSPNQLAGEWKEALVTERGYGSALGIKGDNTLWAWGSNYQGMLGTNDTNDRYSPVQLAGQWTDIAMSASSSYAIKTDGSLWAWGGNDAGQLGTGNTISRSSPVVVAGAWSAVMANGSSIYSGSAAGLRSNGTLWTWGRNNYGQHGTGNMTDRSSPVQVFGSWLQVTGGGHVSTYLAIRTDNTLWAWGHNSYGQHGTGNTTNRSSPVQVEGSWTQVFSAGGVTFGFKVGGSLWAWGRNNEGQLGLGNTVNRSSPVQVPGTTWQQVAIEHEYGKTVNLLRTDGTLWMTGHNYGRRGTGDLGAVNFYSSPVQIAGTWQKLGKSGMPAFK